MRQFVSRVPNGAYRARASHIACGCLIAVSAVALPARAQPLPEEVNAPWDELLSVLPPIRTTESVSPEAPPELSSTTPRPFAPTDEPGATITLPDGPPTPVLPSVAEPSPSLTSLEPPNVTAGGAVQRRQPGARSRQREPELSRVPRQAAPTARLRREEQVRREPRSSTERETERSRVTENQRQGSTIREPRQRRTTQRQARPAVAVELPQGLLPSSATP